MITRRTVLKAATIGAVVAVAPVLASREATIRENPYLPEDYKQRLDGLDAIRKMRDMARKMRVREPFTLIMHPDAARNMGLTSKDLKTLNVNLVSAEFYQL